jgi:hypothetical protein
MSLPIGILVTPTVSSSSQSSALPITTGGVGPSPSIIGALVSSTSIIRSSGTVHLNRSELWCRPPQSEAWVRPPQSFGALVSSTSIIWSSGIVHLNHSEVWAKCPPQSELWYRPPQSFGALVSSTSIVRSSGTVHLNHRRCGRNVLLNRSSVIVHLNSSEVWAKCPPQTALWYRPPHWLARVYPPASPRVGLVRVHSPSDPVMTSHLGLALHIPRHSLRWCDTGLNLISPLDTSTNTTTATKSTSIT